MGRRVIINADDFGLCGGVNRAVAKAHSEGILTSATIMANGPAAQEAVAVSKANPRLGVGVHLNLSEGRPLSKHEGLCDLLDGQGRFSCGLVRLFGLFAGKRRLRKAVRAELEAQLRWVLDQGLRPTHLDSHKHVHAFGPIFGVVCELAKEYGIGAVRWCFEPASVGRSPWPRPGRGGRKRAWLLRGMARINRLQGRSLVRTEALLGVAHTGRINEVFFKAVACYDSAGTVEVMTHPGFMDGLDPNRTRLVGQRKVELDALCSAETREYFREAHIALVHYGEL